MAGGSARGRGATCQLRPPQHSRLQRGTRGRATALAVSGKEAQHASVCRARGAPRWLWLALTPKRGTAPVEGFSHSARGRVETWHLRPPTPSQLVHVRKTGAWRRSIQACRARAPRRAGCGRLWPYGSAQHRREARLLQHAAVLRRVSCSLQRAADCRMATGRRRNTRAVALVVVGSEPTKWRFTGGRLAFFGTQPRVEA